MYCDVTDVEAYYNNVEFDCESYVSASEISMFIKQETAYINASIKRKYSLPITDTDDLIILKTICEKLVVGTVDEIIREKSPVEGEERGRDYRKEAEKLLEKISTGKLILTQTEETSCIKFNNIDSEGNTVTKQFKVADIETTGDRINRENRSIIRVT